MLCFDSPTRYLLIFDIVITHNGDEPLKKRTQECLTLNSAVVETLMPVARGVKLNKKQEEEFSKSDYPMVDFNVE